ncbi:hypothetical protein [Planctomonas deserti]|uniref:hypothetical protein n=1 Tax=Planctomonas deserti TaxID=2144185 RepID=UPI000D38B93D|nr:hypothetical protein [Planctomonas deserti]
MIPLGPGPVPASADELGARLGAGLGRVLAPASGSPVPVNAEPGADGSISRVAADITGIDASSAKDIEPGPIASSTRATIEALSLTGSPAVLRGLPVTIAAEAEHVPVTWNTSGDGSLWLAVEDAATGASGQDAPASARVDVTAAVADLERLVADELSARLGGMGLSLKSLSVAVAALGTRGLDLRADATVGKSFLSAKVTVTGRAQVDEALALTISNVDLSSGNPLVAAVVSRADSMIAPWNGRRIDLATYTFAGARLRDVHVSVDSAIHLHARFGA